MHGRDGLGDGEIDRQGEAVAVEVLLPRLRDVLKDSRRSCRAAAGSPRLAPRSLPPSAPRRRNSDSSAPGSPRSLPGAPRSESAGQPALAAPWRLSCCGPRAA
eukprot:728634-Pleurochrysis_carterae.AAC.1